MPIEPDAFEQQLSGALRREPAPPDFARRLKSRLPIPIWRRPVAWAIAAGLLLAAAMPPVVIEYRHREYAKALEARRELVLALKITSVKLRQTKERVQRSTQRHTS